MKTDRLKTILIVCLLISLIGCSPIANPALPEELTPASSEITPALPSQGETTPMTPAIPTPAAAGLENLVQMAKEDLAQRVSISTNQINLVETTEAEWSDSSLDCPQPGMSYLQVITPGYRILLEANGTQYEYHSNRDTYVIYCDNANPPILPKP